MRTKQEYIDGLKKMRRNLYFNGDKIDLFFKSHKEALKWGRQKKDVLIGSPKE